MIQDTSAQDTKLATKPKPYLWLGFSAVVIGAAAFMGAPALSNWASTEHSLSSEDLRMAKVKRGDFIRDISVQAKVVAAVRPVLYSPAQGTVSFLVDAGDKVEQGQVLARIESPELTSEYQQQAANLQGLKTQLARQVIQAKSTALAKQKDVDKAKVALNAAKREKRRADEAVAKQLISDIDFQKAADDLQNAQLEFNLVLQEAKLLDESQAFETQTKQLEVDTQTLKVDELKRQVESLAMLSPVSGLVGNLLLLAQFPAAHALLLDPGGRRWLRRVTGTREALEARPLDPELRQRLDDWLRHGGDETLERALRELGDNPMQVAYALLVGS